ncbi:MAG: GTPase Era [Holosporaceae bacterium]|jgi:GTP-binding protein Era|nr:GTPase Era [Holosporaceae bacterium]
MSVLDNSPNKKNVRKCGFVAILGETNAGKSTLINQMVGQKVSIVSRKIQTTLTRILGIALYDNSQIILIDTPGFLRENSVESLAKTSWDAFRESDDVLFVLDVCKKNFDASIKLLQKIDAAKKISLVMNKIDMIHKPKLLEISAMFSKIRNFENIFMASALTGNGVEDILKYLSSALPCADWIYPEDEITDSSFEKYVSEITREHIYHRLHQEIPYKCVVKTENYQHQDDGSVKIIQNIYVKNNAHKIIFLGRRGGKIKAIGEAARRELSTLLKKNVHLFLHVLVENNG